MMWERRGSCFGHTSWIFVKVLSGGVGILLALLSVAPRAGAMPPAGGTDTVAESLKNYGYERIAEGKYAVVVNYPRGISWYGAYITCRTHLPGASLFTVDNEPDSIWLGTRVNFEKDKVTGTSKFWVGLTSRSLKGPILWLSGQAYRNHSDVVLVLASGYDDRTKLYAWAVPDGLESRITYELMTVKAEAEAYVCQYKID